MEIRERDLIRELYRALRLTKADVERCDGEYGSQTNCVLALEKAERYLKQPPSERKALSDYTNDEIRSEYYRRGTQVKKSVTIYELEALLDSPDTNVSINPDGTVTVVKPPA